MANILIVDDSKTSRKILRGILENGGHTVLGEAANGEDGLSMFQELSPDIITLDITMPVMDGIATLVEIRKINPDVKVIMITAAAQKSNMIDAVKHGCSDFISKPFEDYQVLDTIKRLTEG